MNLISVEKEPLVLEVKFKKFIFPAVFLFLIVAPVIVFFVHFPVFLTGKFENVFWFANIGISNKKFLFFSSLALYPYVGMMIPQLKIGKYYFFCNRLEIKSFIFSKKYVLQYNNIHAILCTNSLGYGHVVLTDNLTPKFTTNPIKNLTGKYIKGFYIILHNDWLKDSSGISQAIELLKNNVARFEVKHLNWRLK